VPSSGARLSGSSEMNAQKSEARLPKVEDSGKIGIGGGAINLIKPTVKHKGKVKIGGASINLIKDNGKVKVGGGAINLIKPVRK
jgi:hypothetical protein